MSAVETLLAKVLTAHPEDRGYWDTCKCEDSVPAGPVEGRYAAHVAAEQSKALMALLDASGLKQQMTGCLSGFSCMHGDSDACADALFVALADLIEPRE